LGLMFLNWFSFIKSGLFLHPLEVCWDVLRWLRTPSSSLIFGECHSIWLVAHDKLVQLFKCAVVFIDVKK
jgi:hypothetical protein